MSPIGAAIGASFLDRLVDRSLGRADVVLPRLPSLFEPVAPVDTALAARLGDEERAEPATQSPTRATHALDAQENDNGAFASTRSARTADAADGHTYPRHPQTDAPRAADPAVAPVSTENMHVGDAPRRVGVDQALEPAARGVLVSDPAPALASLAPPPHRSALIAARDASAPISRAPHSNPASGYTIGQHVDAVELRARRAADGSQRGPSQPGALDGHTLSEPALLAGALLPRIHFETYVPPSEPLRSMRGAQPYGESPIAHAPMPAVNVTIGRVEVRAVHAPAKDRPHAAGNAPPPLSLVDYLQQRGVRP